MATTMGSLDLNSLQGLRDDLTQYFWFEQNSSATYGAGAHVTLVPKTSFISNPTGQNILMNTDGFSIRNGLLPMMILDNDSLDFNVVDTTSGTYVNVASFGNTTTLGMTDGTQAYMFLNYRSIQGIDKEGDTYFYVSDLRDDNGEYSAKDTFIGDGVTIAFPLSLNVFSNLVVKVDDVEQTINVDYTYNSTTWNITFTSPPTNGAIIEATYISRNQNTKAYTLGNRVVNSTIGGMSLAEGRLTTASGYASHAEGILTVSSGPYSHAEGSKTTARGYSSHAEGGETIASAMSAHAEGNVTTASGEGAHAEGLHSVASAIGAHAEGNATTASAQSAHAEGGETIASAISAHAEGNVTTASAEGAHAEGLRSVASEMCAHAEGGQTIASALSAHAEGNSTTASAQSAHAEGLRSVASGSESHAQNYQTKASSFAQTAIGKCNIEDTTGAYAFIVGNGTADNARSNALTVDWDGNLSISGDIEIKENVNSTASSQTADNWSIIRAVDKNDVRFGYLAIATRTSGTNTTGIYASKVVSGTTKTNGLYLGVDKNGNYSYFVTAPNPFRLAVGIDSGWKSLSSAVASGTYTDVSVTFNKTFSSAPHVVCGFCSTSTGATFGRCSCAVHSITTTGCKIRMFNGDTAARQPEFYWIAVG